MCTAPTGRRTDHFFHLWLLGSSLEQFFTSVMRRQYNGGTLSIQFAHKNRACIPQNKLSGILSGFTAFPLLPAPSYTLYTSFTVQHTCRSETNSGAWRLSSLNHLHFSSHTHLFKKVSNQSFQSAVCRIITTKSCRIYTPHKPIPSTHTLVICYRLSN